MKKIKLLPSVLMLALCIGILGIGIYAATPTNNVITGTITVNAANAGIKVEVWEGESVGTGDPFKSATGRTQTEIDLQNIAIDASNALTLEDVPTKYYTIRFSTTSTHKFVVDTETIQLVNGTVTETSATKEDAIIITKNHKTYKEDNGEGGTGFAYFTAGTGNEYVITCAIKLGELPEQAFTASFDMVFDVYKLEDWVEEGNMGINGIDYLYFGEYPQAEASVTAGDLTADGVFYGYDDNTTSETAGGKVARPAYTDGTNRYVLFDSKYYQIQPLKWRILNQEADGTTKLMCDTIVEQVYFQQFYEYPDDAYAKVNGVVTEDYANNYYVSTLRNYLIDTFYNGAFSASEQVIIKSEEGQVDNSATSHGSSSNADYACANTNDPVFAPSVAEVTNSAYGFVESEYSSDTRKITASAYATATGVYSSQGSGYWWLRSPGASDADYARFVNDIGYVDRNFVDYYDPGCVPALLLGL